MTTAVPTALDSSYALVDWSIVTANPALFVTMALAGYIGFGNWIFHRWLNQHQGSSLDIIQHQGGLNPAMNFAFITVKMVFLLTWPVWTAVRFYSTQPATLSGEVLE